LADYLAHQPIEDYQPMQPGFPYDDISAIFAIVKEEDVKNTWNLFFDGAPNALGLGIGAVLISPEKQYILVMTRLCFDCTNNKAKHEACAMGIRAAIEFKVKFLNVYGDFALVIHQIKGEWETSDQKLIPYQVYMKVLMEYFDAIVFHHVPREENQLAHALATLSSMFELNQEREFPTIRMRSHEHPVYCYFIIEEPDGKLGTLISSDTSKVVNILNIMLSGDVLYKRNHDIVLLRCVDDKEAELILRKVHEGTFETHMTTILWLRKY